MVGKDPNQANRLLERSQTRRQKLMSIHVLEQLPGRTRRMTLLVVEHTQRNLDMLHEKSSYQVTMPLKYSSVHLSHEESYFDRVPDGLQAELSRIIACCGQRNPKLRYSARASSPFSSSSSLWLGARLLRHMR